MNQAPLFTAPQPLVVAYGLGVDSTAMLIEMKRRDVRPDLILFADLHAEKPETYAYLPQFQEWLKDAGFPPVTTVSYQPVTAPYSTLEGKCLQNEWMPDPAYHRQSSCSSTFKAGPQHKFLTTWQPAIEAWAAGLRVRKAIGYDAGARDQKRRCKADTYVDRNDDGRYDYWYPLQDWGIDREQCAEIIQSAGLPVPPKSACFFCPSSKREEVIWLRDTHPALFERAVAIERQAVFGRHPHHKIKGLGSSYAWGDLAEKETEDASD